MYTYLLEHISILDKKWKRTQFYASKIWTKPVSAKRAYIAWIEDEYFIKVTAWVHESPCNEEDPSCHYIEADEVIELVDHTFWWHTEEFSPQEWAVSEV